LTKSKIILTNSLLVYLSLSLSLFVCVCLSLFLCLSVPGALSVSVSPCLSLSPSPADGLSQLQAALSSTQQFQQMFDELRCWLDDQADTRDSSADSLPCQPDALRALLAHAENLQRGMAAQRGSHDLLQAEGAALLAALPAGGDERSALQSRLSGLRQDWDGQNQRVADRQNRLRATLAKAETYQRHRADLAPWLEGCEGKEAEIRPSLDPAAVDEALQKARALSMEMERRRPLVDALNTAADQLLEQCRVGEEEVASSLLTVVSSLIVF